MYYCLKKHPEVFTNKKIVNLEFITRLEACVDTRIFGTSRLKNSAMIPFCDAINHSHVRNSNQTVSRQLHLKGDSAQGHYFTPKKFQIDYSIAYDNLQSLSNDQSQLVKGLFNQEIYASNRPVDYQDFISNYPEKAIWEVPWIIELLGQQDNDDIDSKDCDTDSDEEELKREIGTQNEVVLLSRYKSKLEKKVTKINCQVVETKMERAKLMIKDWKEGYKPIHKTWWECTEQEFRKTKPEQVVKITDHEEENYEWYTPELDGETYFCYTNTNRRILKPGEQVFNCYGNYTNRSLMKSYGFCFQGNHFESVTFFLVTKE